MKHGIDVIQLVTMLTRRALKEISDSYKSPDFEFFHDAEGKYNSEEPNNSYIRWTVREGLYKDQQHLLRIKWTYGSNEKKTFPVQPPNVVFMTPMWHTNVSQSSNGGGGICVDILREDSSNPNAWSPMYSLSAIFTSILVLLIDHNCNSAYNGAASNDYSEAKKLNRMDIFIDRANRYYHDNLNKIPEDHSLKRLLNAPEFNRTPVEPKYAKDDKDNKEIASATLKDDKGKEKESSVPKNDIAQSVQIYNV